MWLTPEVREHLIYWKNPRDSGIIFGAVLVILLAVRYVSIISVMANLGLALIVSTMAFRIYKSVLSAVNKTEDGHPFKHCLSFDVTLPVDQVRETAIFVVKHINAALAQIKSAILIEDMIKSLKFAAAMYALTYIGRMFYGTTVLITLWVIAFSAPKIYRDNQTKIDEALKPIKEKVDELLAKMKPQPSEKKVD